jgi:hypothetical protein
MSLRRALGTVLAVLLATGSGPARGDAADAPSDGAPRSEYNVKAAFLYSFGRYVAWPSPTFEETQGAFVIGVLGEDPFGDALDRIAAAKKVHDRPVVVRRFRTAADYQPCHIVFFPKSTAAEEQAAAARELGSKPVLLVGESPGFAGQGGTVNFFLDQGTVRFEINTETARRQQLVFDAKLLNLAVLAKKP